MGYFSYEWVKRKERINTDHQILTPFSDFHLAFVKELLVYDHEKQRFLFTDHLNGPMESDEEKEKEYHQVLSNVRKKAKQWKECLRIKATLSEIN
ncbi:hypothetical protein [Tepidibacillus marianensis]|uniref:hypothetical protein n=1 Tax=Tepidibacillus marianensis TaxID=3131995 RepID=UPI0030D4696C